MSVAAARQGGKGDGLMRIASSTSCLLFLVSIHACAIPEMDAADGSADARATRDGGFGDARAVDAAGDAARSPQGTYSPDAAVIRTDARTDGASTAGEICDDGLDNDRDGAIDENCPCTPGAQHVCFPGDPTLAGIGACALGMETCTSDGEIGAWGPCVGAGAPAAERCNGIDDDCDGIVDEGIAESACGTDVGACAPGTRRCVNGAMTCVGAIGPAPEICRNGIDDDCDGQVDEGCICFSAGTSPWHQYLDPHVYCYGQDLDRNMREFSYAIIPLEGDARWGARGVTTIDFQDPSTIPSRDYCGGTHWGGVFSYFETFVDIPAGSTVASLRLTISDVDDGVRVTVFNSRYPSGVSDSTWHAFDAGLNIDLAARVVIGGRNRIVLTHLDDNPVTRALTGVHLSVNGITSQQCR